MSPVMYTVIKRSDLYLVVNVETQEVQSSWTSKEIAIDVVKVLNRIKWRVMYE